MDPERTPTQIEARSLTQQAIYWFEKQEWKRAAELAAKAEKLDPTHDLSVRVQGWCAVATGDDEKAETLLTRALNLEPANLDVQFLLATCHRRLEQWEAAKDLLADLLKKQPPMVAVLLELSACLVGEADPDGALVLLAQARVLAPKEREVIDAVIAVHEQKEDWAAAAAEVRPLLAASPGDPVLRWKLIQCLLNGQDWKAAVAELEEATRVRAEDPQPHQILAERFESVAPDPTKLELHRGWLKAWNLRRR